MGHAMLINLNNKWRISAIFGMVCVLSIMLYAIFNQPRFVVIDMTRAIQEPANRLSHSKLSKSRQEKIMQRYAVLLPKVIKDYGQSNNKTVFSATVLSGQNKGLDITNEIINKTLMRLKHEA